MDAEGNPAFIDKNNKIHRKLKGEKWTKLAGCASYISFGGDGSLWKEDCEDFKLKKLDENDKWVTFGGTKYASAVAVDDRGTPWIVDYGKKVLRYSETTNSWEEMGLEQADRIAVGSSDHVYALKKSKKLQGHYEIYRWLEGTNWMLI